MHIVMLLLQVWAASPELYEQQWAQGRQQLRQGQYADAILTLQASLQGADEAHADPRSLSIVLSDLAEAYRYVGQYSKTEPLYDRALALLRTLPECSRELIMILNNQGTMYREKRLYFRSLASFEEAMAVAKKTHLENDPIVGATLNGMAAVTSLSKGDLKSAARHIEQSLRIREAVLGPDHLDVSETLNNLGVVLVQQKKYAKAESAFLRALQITENHLGPEHPDVAVTLSNLGVLYNERKQYDTAEKVLSRALEIRQQKLPANHPGIADNLLNLASVLMKTKRFTEAQTLLRQAVEIHSENASPPSMEKLLALERYAVVLRLNGNSSDAERIDARARYMRADLKYILRP